MKKIFKSSLLIVLASTLVGCTTSQIVYYATALSLEDILNAKEKLDEEKLYKNKLNKDNNNKINNNDNKIIKKPVFEQIYKNKNK